MKWLRVLCGAVMAMALGLGPVGAAGAAPRTDPAAGTSAASASAADEAATLAYWTPERMEATWAAQEGREGAGRGAGAAAKQDAAVEAATARFAADRSLRSSVDKTVGRVFYVNTETQLPEACSASALNSPSRMMVITSAHCAAVGGSRMNGGEAKWFKRTWVYVPAVNGGDPYPYGKFTWKLGRVFNDWLDTANAFDSDVAMITVNPNAEGKRLVDATGANGLVVNQRDEVTVTAVGYPGNLDNGAYQVECTGTLERLILYPILLEMPCRLLGHGASGGPWLWTDPQTLRTSVNGVTRSHDGVEIDTPYFDDRVVSMYNEQGSVT
ncbi:trypsin-like serine peptidase [Kitasatospora sp. NPDC057692]|uniref:trypsin-like serine peptidase n=1 Tax=Kitasatospora sp. NPDC057692 TaxID=3346215 RepID=UPI00369FF966